MDDFDFEIEQSVRDGNSLGHTKLSIAAKFKHELNEFSRYEELRIEEKYVKFLVSVWLADVPEEVVNHIDSNYILEFIKRLNLAKTIVDCNNLLSTFQGYKRNFVPSILYKYSFPLLELSTISSALSDQEIYYVHLFKCHCSQLLENKFGYLTKDQNFFDLLLDFIKTSKSPEKLCGFVGLEPNKNSFGNILNFKQTLEKIIEYPPINECFMKVQQSAKQMINNEDFFINKDIIEVIISYLVPTDLSKKIIDGRVVLEVSGNHIVVSKIKKQIEGMMRFYRNIEEVRFVNANVIHVDTDLSVDIWHGMNIVVFAETVIVRDDKKVIWNVSGSDGVLDIHNYKTPFRLDGFGLAGIDGQHGESGGNVLIMVDILRNGHNFTVKSNGGNGSNGQDGGKGDDGEDGFYYKDKYDFENVFPPVEIKYNINIFSICTYSFHFM